MTSSFDVFDTVITRLVSRPSAVFLLAGNAAPRPMTPVEFARMRVKAERQAEAKAPGGQPTFDEIYAELASSTRWSDAEIATLQRIELEIEKRLSHGIPETLRAIERARRAGTSVLFISDMYLPVEVISGFLAKCGAWANGDRVYVSCECRASKREGGLFRKVLAAEGLEPRQLIHCGDNELGDSRQPRDIGIRAELVRPATLNRYEEILDGYCDSTTGISALLAGTGRIARLNAPNGDAFSTALETVACNVAAPVLAAFSGWVLQEASRRGIRRLYFVSRDGYVIKDFAEALAATMPSPPELRYLYGSRQAWRSVATKHSCKSDVSWAFEATASVSVRTIFERLGCAPSVAEDLLDEWGFPPSEWSRDLSAADLGQLETRFGRCEEIQSRVATATCAKKAAAMGYLTQEGLLDDVPWALVDLGWHGSLQATLSSLLNERGGACRMGLYFGLRSRGAKGPSDEECAAFAFDQDRHEGDVPVPDLLYLMESFCTAPHGTCIGYEESEGRHHAVFRDGHEVALAGWGLEVVHEAYRRYLDLLPTEFLRGLDWSDLRDAVIELLREFSVNPGATEARAWGRFPYENDQNASVAFPLAEAKTSDWQSLLYCMKIGELPHPFIEWQGGAWSQTEPVSRRLLRFACGLGKIKARLGRVIKG